MTGHNETENYQDLDEDTDPTGAPSFGSPAERRVTGPTRVASAPQAPAATEDDDQQGEREPSAEELDIWGDEAPRRARLRAGEVLGGRYRIDERLDAGTAGVVYRASDLEQERAVAIKVGSRAADEGRFAREVEALAELSHPGIVRYLDAGRTDEGAPFVVTELLKGRTLSERMGEALPIDDVLDLVVRIADALGVVHAAGIVHRDLKPANVFLVDGKLSSPRIIDFGLLYRSRAEDRRVDPTVTPDNVLIGTPEYMAPEQIAQASGVTPAADVFSLGCILFEALSGTHPFRAPDVWAVLSKIMWTEPPPLRSLRAEVGRPLSELIGRMLHKHPAERPADGRTVAEALRQIPPSALSTIPPSSRPRPSLTLRELRVMSVIVAAVGPADDASSRLERLRADTDRFGAELVQLAGGPLVATVTGTGDAVDRATLAARCAITLARRLSRVAIALATGRGDTSGPLPDGEVIERAVLLARAADRERPPPDDERPRIRIDSLSAELLHGRFDIDRDGAAVRLREERREPRAAERTTRTSAPLAGRRSELGRLRSLLAATLADRQPRAVIVRGSPGIGKSRLVHELTRGLRPGGDRKSPERRPQDAAVAKPGSPQATRLWVAQGDPMKQGAAFAFLADIVRDALQLRRDETVFVRRQKIRDRVDAFFDWPDSERIAEFLGELAGTPFNRRHSVQLRAADADPLVMGDQMQAAFLDWIAAECREQPVVLVLDDLHWGDRPTMSCLELLLRERHAALLLVGLARPEIDETFAELWASVSPDRVDLGPLPDDALSRLVHHRLGRQADANTVSEIVRRAGGNPLYCEELTRAEQHGSAMHGAVLTMVQARLESLPPVVRRVLRAGAIYGGVFTHEAIAALLDDAARLSLDQHLDTLLETDLVEPVGVAGIPDGRFRIIHPLAQDAAYESLTDEDRVVGHALAAEFLLRQGETPPLVLAKHYELAGKPHRAADWFARAAFEALEASDLPAVQQYASRAVECGVAQQTYGALRLASAEAHRWRGETVAARDCAFDAVQAFEPTALEHLFAQAEWALAESRLGRREPIFEVAERLRQTLLRAQPSRRLVLVATQVATHLIVLGAADESRKLGVRLEVMARRLADTDPAVEARLALLRAWQAAHEGDAAARLMQMQTVLSCLEQTGDARHACRERVNLAAAYLDLGDAERAEAETRIAIATGQRLGLEAIVALAQRYLGMALLASEDFEEARDVLESAQALFSQRGNLRMETATAVTLVRTLLALGRVEDATARAREAISTGSSSPDRCLALAAFAETALAAGDAGVALRRIEEASSILDEMGGMDEAQSYVRRLHVEALNQSGRTEEARVMVEAAVARIVRAAARLVDPAHRAGLMLHVTDHARTLDLARELGVAVPEV